uniref:GH16 domain-containing protein n=1 Tax=Arcella intermedia TaxID=1963864 RepID=A0A6B2LGH5_9EUKA
MGGLNYTSGAVTSKLSWTNARVCVHAKLPGFNSMYARGIWPAHWLLPADKSCWPDHGEIDIMEMINGDGNVHGTYHWNPDYPNTQCNYKDGSAGGYTSLSGNSWASEYHEYATEWGRDYVTFLLDGKVYVNITAESHNPPPQFPSVPMYLILNTAVGGPWPGPPNDHTQFPTYHYIDTVTVATKA